MRICTSDVIARIDCEETDGLTDVSFGGPADLYFQICRLSRERSKSLEVVEQGVKDVYSEINDQSRATYGGIVGCVLTNNSFRIDFDEKASKDLQDGRVDVDLITSPNVVKRLRDALQCIFRDTSLFEDKTNLV